MNNSKLSRRTFIHSSSLIAAGTIAGTLARTGQAITADDVERVVKNGRINQSVCKWCYSKLSLDELCAAAAKMGLKSIDLLDPSELPTVKNPPGVFQGE